MSNLTVKEMVERSREAQEVFATFTQEQVDRIALAICKLTFDHREDFSVRAVEETKLGFVENKVLKHVAVPTHTIKMLRGAKSIGLIDDDKVNCIKTYAKPVGVIACLTPSTGPTLTATMNAANALKGGNSIIIAPHPSAKNVSMYATNLMRDKIVELGGPADIVQCIAEPSMEATHELMTAADVVIATGGPAMVKSAYSSGKPSFGVGPGNVQVIFDEDFTDFEEAVAGIVMNRALDNGMLCTGEQTMFLPRNRAEEILNKFTDKNCYIIKDEKILDRIRDEIFVNGRINAKYAGRTAVEIAKMFDIPAAEGTPLLMAEYTKHADQELLSREILFPFTRFVVYDNFKDAVQMARENLMHEGAGHTASIYSNNDERIGYAGSQIPVGRLVVNQNGAAGSGGSEFNGLEPTMSLGCGSWGGNSISENLVYHHTINKTRVAYKIPGVQAWDLPDYAAAFDGVE